MDYEKLGFKCGIEIHQQLETHKLFCNCPSIVHDTNPDIKVFRKLRAAEGETGKIDEAAEHEHKKDKFFVYEACSSSSCPVELDEEPPHEINIEALNIVIQVAKMLNAKIVDQLQVMRKTVVDGSNPSGFQRTVLVAMDGYVETSKGKVTIPLICLEEEAAKKISEDEESVTYRLDRLGIPLIELGTDPDIKDPEHAKETAEKLGMILRSTGKVKRGIGSIRQDVNVSIKKGDRIEVKGFQDLKSIPKVIEFEVKRQVDLVKKGKKVIKEVRKANPDGTTTFLRPMPTSARMYPETDITHLLPQKNKVEKVELLDDKINRIVKSYKINSDFANIIVKKDFAFEELVKKYPEVSPSFIAETLVSTPKEIRKRHGIEIDVFAYVDEVFSKLDQGSIGKEAVFEILVMLGNGKKVDYSKFKTLDPKSVEKEVKKIVDKNKGAPFGAVMGEAMKQFRGKVDGKVISDIINKLI